MEKIATFWAGTHTRAARYLALNNIKTARAIWCQHTHPHTHRHKEWGFFYIQSKNKVSSTKYFQPRKYFLGAIFEEMGGGRRAVNLNNFALGLQFDMWKEWLGSLKCYSLRSTGQLKLAVLSFPYGRCYNMDLAQQAMPCIRNCFIDIFIYFLKNRLVNKISDYKVISLDFDFFHLKFSFLLCPFFPIPM